MKDKRSCIIGLAVTLAVFASILFPGKALAFAATCGGSNNVCTTSCTYTAQNSGNHSTYKVSLNTSYCCSHDFTEAELCNIGAADVGAQAGSGSWNQSSGNSWGTWSGTLVSQTATCGSAATNPSASFPSSATACSAGTLETVSTSGWVAPGIGTKVTDGGATIVPNNAFTSNNIYTVFDNNVDVVDYTNLGVSIPSSATITGIEFSLEGQKSGARTLNLSISPNNGASFTAVKNLGSAFTSTDKTSIAGSASDTWGRTWSPSEFADGSLKLRLASAASTGSISIDQVKLQVSYTTATTTATTYGWTCLGTSSRMSDTTCTGPRIVAGVCGSATTTASYSFPSSNTCSIGTVTATSSSSTVTPSYSSWLAPTTGTKIADAGAIIMPNDALTSNNAYTKFDTPTDTVDYSNMGISSIPAGSNITGIEVSTEGIKSHPSTRRVLLSLSSNSGSSFSNVKTVGATFGPSDSTEIAGGPNDTWGRSWSVSDFTNTVFRLRSQGNTATVSGDDIHIDQFKVKVYYTPAGTVDTLFNWTCQGINTGADATCTTLKKIDGVCNYPPAGQSTYIAPTASCATGTPSVVTLTGTFPSQLYQWTCSAINGGVIPTCTAPKDPCNSSQTYCSFTNTCLNNGTACVGPTLKIDSFYFKPDIGSTAFAGKCPVFWSTSLTGGNANPSLVSCNLNGTSVASTSPSGLTESPGRYNLTCIYDNLSTIATTSSAKCSNSPNYIEK